MLADAIRAEINPEYLRELVAQVKTMQKETAGWCPNCERRVVVSVPDLPRVISALTELLEQAEGRPGIVSTEDGNITLIVERHSGVARGARPSTARKEPESPAA
jgi:hypothetical protein